MNTCAVLSESKRIINAHLRHFLAISALFFLLLSHCLNDNSQAFLFLSGSDEYTIVISTSTLLLSFAYSFFFLLFSLLALAFITFISFLGFYGHPVKLLSAVRSRLASFLPLLATALVISLVASVIAVVFSLFLAVSAFRLLGLPLVYLAPAIALAAGLTAVLIYLQLNWTLVRGR